MASMFYLKLPAKSLIGQNSEWIPMKLLAWEPPALRPIFKRFHKKKPMRGLPKDLVVPSVTSSRAFCSFQVTCAMLWNSTPFCIRDLSSFSRFKTNIQKQQLKFELEFDVWPSFSITKFDKLYLKMNCDKCNMQK